MRFRNAFLAFLFVLTILFGAWILLDDRTSSVAKGLDGAPLGEVLNQNSWVNNPGKILDTLESNTFYLVTIFGQNRELLIYGAIALFGILMMGLAIGSATSTSRDNSKSIVEVLKEEKEKAENLARLKSDFLNQVSHELRTPLAVIIGYLECITDGLYGQLEDKHQEILQIVAKQSSHLKNMIDQILIFSRLESNKQPLRIEEFSIDKIMNDLKETFTFLCDQKNITLNWELPREITSLKSDPDRFKEIVSNLLQNAVKYTDHGAITVRLRSLVTTDSIILEVSDTGIGIPENYLPTIFEPFIQAHKTSSENSRGGIGLGLSIVRKHVEQIKGTITAESELGSGSTFKIIIPRIFQEGHSRRKNLFSLLNFSRQIRPEPPAITKVIRTSRDVRPRTTATG